MLGALLVAYAAQAQDSLRFFKHYFGTGDYTVGGVGLRGTGVGGIATGASRSAASVPGEGDPGRARIA